MSNLSILKMIASVVVLSTSIAPAFADHDDYRHDYKHGRGHAYGHSKDRNRNGISDRVEKQWAKQDLRRAQAFRTYPNSWNDQRVYFANNWNRQNSRYDRAQRAALEAQMRTQWQSYYPNYNGQYNWNTYNNPGFLDYVHNQNPGLFTQIRNAIGI